MTELDDLLEEILVDAYGDSEQLTALEQAFEESAQLPFAGQVVGKLVEVVAITFDGNERRGLVAACRDESRTFEVSLQDITPLESVTPETGSLFRAYRRWMGLDSG